MCGRYNVSDRPETQQLLTALRVEGRAVPRRNIAPGAHGQFVIERDGQRELLDGLWSLRVPSRTTPARIVSCHHHSARVLNSNPQAAGENIAVFRYVRDRCARLSGAHQQDCRRARTPT
ncbi:MAG: hypothetical protein Q8J78_01370 [Moraxellaceae bacterium]|nr:hypothetical protein [Moraxellaceae bacterium]